MAILYPPQSWPIDFFEGCSYITLHNVDNKLITTLKNVTRRWNSRSAKAGKQGRDDSKKQFSIQLHPTYLFTVKDMYGGVVY